MKEQWSVSKEKLVTSVEDGLPETGEGSGTRPARSSGRCNQLIQFAKLILYVELVLIAGGAVYFVWQTYRTQPVAAKAADTIRQPQSYVLDQKSIHEDDAGTLQLEGINDTLMKLNKFLHAEEIPSPEQSKDDDKSWKLWNSERDNSFTTTQSPESEWTRDLIVSANTDDGSPLQHYQSSAMEKDQMEDEVEQSLKAEESKDFADKGKEDVITWSFPLLTSILDFQPRKTVEIHSMEDEELVRHIDTTQTPQEVNNHESQQGMFNAGEITKSEESDGWSERLKSDSNDSNMETDRNMDRLEDADEDMIHAFETNPLLWPPRLQSPPVSIEESNPVLFWFKEPSEQITPSTESPKFESDPVSQETLQEETKEPEFADSSQIKRAYSSLFEDYSDDFYRDMDDYPMEDDIPPLNSNMDQTVEQTSQMLETKEAIEAEDMLSTLTTTPVETSVSFEKSSAEEDDVGPLAIEDDILSRIFDDDDDDYETWDPTYPDELMERLRSIEGAYTNCFGSPYDLWGRRYQRYGRPRFLHPRPIRSIDTMAFNEVTLAENQLSTEASGTKSTAAMLHEDILEKRSRLMNKFVNSNIAEKETMEQTLNDLFHRMEVFSVHIDRLHKRYLRQGELKDDYISSELPPDSLESESKFEEKRN